MNSYIFEDAIWELKRWGRSLTKFLKVVGILEDFLTNAEPCVTGSTNSIVFAGLVVRVDGPSRIGMIII